MCSFGMLGSKGSFDQRADPVQNSQNEEICPNSQELDLT